MFCYRVAVADRRICLSGTQKGPSQVSVCPVGGHISPCQITWLVGCIGMRLVGQAPGIAATTTVMERCGYSSRACAAM